MANYNLGSLYWTIEANTNNFIKNLNGTNKSVDTFKKAGTQAFDSVQNSLNGLLNRVPLVGGALTSLISKFNPLVSLSLAASTAVVGLGLKSAKTADDLLDLEAATGLTAENLQKLNYVAINSGVEFDKVAKSAEIFTKRLTTVSEDGTRVSDIMKEIGVSVLDQSGKLRDVNEVYFETITALQKLKNPTEKSAYAFKIFGNSVNEIAPILQKTDIEFKKLTTEAEKAGFVLNRSTLEASAKVKDSMDKLKGSVGQLANSLGSTFAPILGVAVDGLNGFFSAINKIDPVLKSTIGYTVALTAGIGAFVLVSNAAKAATAAFMASEMAANVVSAYRTIVFTANNAVLLAQTTLEGKSAIVKGIMIAKTWLMVAAEQALALIRAAANPILLASIAAVGVAIGVSVAYAAAKAKEAKAVELSTNKTKTETEAINLNKTATMQNMDALNSYMGVKNNWSKNEAKTVKINEALIKGEQEKLEQQKEADKIYNQIIADKNKELIAVEKLAVTNKKLNIEYDANKAKQEVLLNTIKKLIDEGYKVEGSTITNLMNDYENLNAKKEENVDVISRYNAQLELLKQKETELQAIKGAGTDTEKSRIADLEKEIESMKTRLNLEKQTAVESKSFADSVKEAKAEWEDLSDLEKFEVVANGLSAITSAFLQLGDVISQIKQQEIDQSITALENEQNMMQQGITYKQATEEQKAAMDKEYLKKKANLEYEANLTAWQFQLSQAIIQGIMAPLNAFSSALAIPIAGVFLAPIMMAVAAATAGAQIAQVAKAKPQKPQFAVGINEVPSDMDAVVHQGEMIIPKTFADSVRSGDLSIGNGGGSMLLNIMLDGKTIAKKTVEYINNGVATIEARGLA